MKTLIHTSENIAKLEALKKVKETQWSGETKHRTIDECLTSINLFLGINSGFYNPKGVRLKGLKGIYLLNQDGSLCAESRIIKIDNITYKIEHLGTDGYNVFLNEYNKVLSNKLI